MTGPARQSGSGPRRPVEPAQRLTPPPERASASPATAARSALATQPDDLPATLHPPSGCASALLTHRRSVDTPGAWVPVRQSPLHQRPTAAVTQSQRTMDG